MWADGLFEFCKTKNNNFVIIFSIVWLFFLSLQESIFHLVSHLYTEPCLLLALQSFCGSHVLSLNNWSSHWIHMKVERLGLRRSRSRGFRVRLDIGIREIFAYAIWKQRNTAQRIRNPSNDWNPESNFNWKRLERGTGIRNPLRGIQNPKLSWIPLYGAIDTHSLFTTSATRFAIFNPERFSFLVYIIP